MFLEEIVELAPAICKRHAAIGGVGADEGRMRFLLRVQAQLSPSMIFTNAKIGELVRELEMKTDEFIYLLDIYSQLSGELFPNKEAFDALVEEYAFSFGHAGDCLTETSGLKRYASDLSKVIPNSKDVRDALKANPWLIALHSMTTWVLPIEQKRPGGR